MDTLHFSQFKTGLNLLLYANHFHRIAKTIHLHVPPAHIKFASLYFC
jgi:hypothetical protein